MNVLDLVLENDTGYKIDRSIFRQYDIRGVVNHSLFAEDAYYIGKAFASRIIETTNENVFLVARDGRLTSPVLSEALIIGILSAGGDVIDLGIAPTPMLYFGSNILRTAGSIMITGSHNEADYNGFKLVAQNKPFFGGDIISLMKMIETESFIEGRGSLIQSDYDIKQMYLAELLDSCLINNSDLKIAWDPSNGAAGDIVKLLCEQLPGNHFLINLEIDGSFPNHHPNPSLDENLVQLQNLIIEKQCDFGVAFDGDADRVVFLDDQARVVSAEDVIRIFVADIIVKSPKAKIITDIKVSQLLLDELAESGANIIMWKTGHSYIKDKIAQTSALFAAEMSGHFFFADKYYGFDDGIYAAVRMVELISRTGLSISQYVDSMPERNISQEFRLECPDARKFIVIEEMKLQLVSQNIKFIDLDGIRVSNEIGWWIIRASNTEPALVVKYEVYVKKNDMLLKQQIIQLLYHSDIITFL